MYVEDAMNEAWRWLQNFDFLKYSLDSDMKALKYFMISIAKNQNCIANWELP